MIRFCSIFCIFSLVLFGCSAHSSQGKLANTKHDTNEIQIIQKDTAFTCKCNDGIYSVKVISKYLDSSPDSNFVLNQKLIFIKDGINVNTVELPFDYTVIDILNTKVKVYKSVLLEAKCITSKSGKIIYSFYGSHALILNMNFLVIMIKMESGYGIFMVIDTTHLKSLVMSQSIKKNLEMNYQV
ncbi:MAG: hypothetical protein IPJ83_06820 [Saprospiraceae bacterium]|nr:hypothetical protein [Candidatus Vicinibacter proximus]